MKKIDYLKELESRLAKLNEEDKQDALSYYEEIFEERGIENEDEVPRDMQSPKKASYEIIRDISIENLEDFHMEGNKSKHTTMIGIIILSILAMPTISIISIILLALIIGALIIGIAVIGASTYELYELIFVFPVPVNIVRCMYLVGIIFMGISSILMTIIIFKFIVKNIKKKLLESKIKRGK